MTDRRLISIVTPCFNEELNVAVHLAEVQAAIEPFRDRYDFEHIYTDNCSHDRTFELLTQLTEEHPDVRAMRFARNIGPDNAIYMGLQQARGDAVIVIQADLQDPPSLLPEFIRGWEEGNDIVFGQIRTRGEGWVLQRFRKLYYWLIDRFGEVSVPQNAGEFRLCSRRAVDALLRHDEQEIYMRGVVALVGFRQKAIPYDRASRRAGESSQKLSNLFSYAINGMISTTLVPIRLVTVVGFAMAVLGLFLTVLTVALKILFPGVAPQGFTTLAVLITLFCGVQMLGTGVIGEYLRKTYKQSLQRPRGFIAERVGQGWDEPMPHRAEADVAREASGTARPPRHPIVEEDLDRVLQEDLPWERFDGRTVLVTGAAGFLASWVVDVLLRRNDLHGAGTRVLALVRNEAKARARFSDDLGRGDLHLRVGDASVRFSEPGPIDFIIHAASAATPATYGADPVGTLLPNTVGTHHLLELAREKGAQGFLFFSSAEVYGQLDPEDGPVVESATGRLDPTVVRSSYAESKRAGEALCVAYAHQHRVPACIVRPFHTYGPGMALGDGRVYSDFAADVVAGRDIVMKSSGQVVRSFCYVADATRGIFTALLLGEPGRPYNVANPDAASSVLELAETLVASFPERGLRVVRATREPGDPYLESPQPSLVADTSRLAALGWKPEIGIADGFRRTVRSFEPAPR
jgi:UDP-glucuronate decarboxylase